MNEQIGNALDVGAVFTQNGIPKIGLDVTVDVAWLHGGDLLVLGTDLPAIDRQYHGLYTYTIPASGVTHEGLYIATFIDNDALTDTPEITAYWAVGKGGVEYLNGNYTPGNMTMTGIVADDGDVTVVQGFDYLGVYSLKWALSSPPETPPDSITFTCQALGLSKLCDYAPPTIALSLTAEETAALGIGVYEYQIEANTGGERNEIVRGAITVERDV